LLNNFLYDISQVAIPTDQVDPEYLEKPKPWNVRRDPAVHADLRAVSSLFDFITFGVLLFFFKYRWRVSDGVFLSLSARKRW